MAVSPQAVVRVLPRVRGTGGTARRLCVNISAYKQAGLNYAARCTSARVLATTPTMMARLIQTKMISIGLLHVMAPRSAASTGPQHRRGQSVRIAGRWIGNQWSPVLCRPGSHSKSASMPVNAGAGLSGDPGAIGANRSNFHYGIGPRGRSELPANSGQTFAIGGQCDLEGVSRACSRSVVA